MELTLSTIEQSNWRVVNLRDLALVVTPPEVTGNEMIVKEYSYDMNGEHMGQLLLLSQPQRVSFRSARTGLTSDWHGCWQEMTLSNGEKRLAVFFDYRGRDFGVTKWARLWENGFDYQGFDYRGRMIEAELDCVWRLQRSRISS